MASGKVRGSIWRPCATVCIRACTCQHSHGGVHPSCRQAGMWAGRQLNAGYDALQAGCACLHSCTSPQCSHLALSEEGDEVRHEGLLAAHRQWRAGAPAQRGESPIQTVRWCRLGREQHACSRGWQASVATPADQGPAPRICKPATAAYFQGSGAAAAVAAASACSCCSDAAMGAGSLAAAAAPEVSSGGLAAGAAALPPLPLRPLLPGPALPPRAAATAAALLPAGVRPPAAASTPSMA